MVREFMKRIESLDNIRQWEERDSAVHESVSQHSFKVSSLAIFMLRTLEAEAGVELGTDWTEFKYRCIEYATLHDFDEAILTRDISHVVKYNTHNGEAIRNALTEYVEWATEKLGFSFLKLSDVPEEVRVFVKMCDWLALLSFIFRNEQIGDRTMSAEKTYCRNKATLSLEKVRTALETKFGIKNSLVTICMRYIYGR